MVRLPNMQQEMTASQEKSARRFWLVVFGLNLAAIIVYREWLPLPDDARFLAILATGAALFLGSPLLFLILMTAGAMRLWMRDLRSAAFRLLLPVVAVLLFFVIPERKLVETVLHFRADPQHYKRTLASASYREMTGPHAGWLIVYSRSDDPESFGGDSVHGGFCAERGSVYWKLEPHWYVCREDVDVP